MWRYKVNMGSGMGQEMAFGADWMLASLAVGVSVVCAFWPRWWWLFPTAIGFYGLRFPVEWAMNRLYDRARDRKF